jgi:hypothetical protein
LDSCVIGGELLVDALGLVVSPGGDLFTNFAQTADAPTQALFRQYVGTLNSFSVMFNQGVRIP